MSAPPPRYEPDTRRRRYIPLGVIVSSASRPAMLAVLRELRPQFDVRLNKIAEHGEQSSYRVEVAVVDRSELEHSIDAWLRIKSALIAGFPPGKPGTVTALDPEVERREKRSG
ncbi:MAG TPA: hypothetical protein VFB32_13980 [Rudaea sp.]|nr:hypothetical protein [Rudaea sp.]